eukprot:scaffold36981_cov50-Phaeocystis_antarctica.AAC.1
MAAVVTAAPSSTVALAAVVTAAPSLTVAPSSAITPSRRPCRLFTSSAVRLTRRAGQACDVWCRELRGFESRVASSTVHKPASSARTTLCKTRRAGQACDRRVWFASRSPPLSTPPLWRLCTASSPPRRWPLSGATAYRTRPVPRCSLRSPAAASPA